MMEKIREHKKMVTVIVILLVLVLGFGFYEYRSRKAAQEAAAELVLKGNVDLREVSLAFRNSDRISDIYGKKGTR